MSDKIAIIGLVYVGLPLAVAFAEKYRTIGFDIDRKRVKELLQGHDRTLEVEDKELREVLLDDSKEFSNPKNGLIISGS